MATITGIVPGSLPRNLPPQESQFSVNRFVGFEFAPLVEPYTVPGDPFATRIIQRLISKRPDPSDADAVIEWGGPSDFEARVPDFPTQTITVPDDEDDFSISVDVPTLVFNESEDVPRVSEDVRIENPDDENQYVIERRPTQVTFEGPDLRPEGGIAGVSQVPKTFRFEFIYYQFNFIYPDEGTA